MHAVRKHFLQSAQRKHALLTHDELLKYCKEKKLSVDDDELRNIRGNWMAMAKRRNYVKGQKYQSTQVYRLGRHQIDFGFFHEEWSKWNGGSIGFLCVSSEYGALDAVPLKGRKIEDFEYAVETLCKTSALKQVSTLQSDGEAAVMSPKFKERMRELYNIEIQRLGAHVKAWRAERGIGTVKRKLATILELQDVKNDVHARRRWVDLLPGIIRHHNSLPAKNTEFSRDEIDASNWYEFLDQWQGGGGDFTLRLNSRSISGADIVSDKFREMVLDYAVGDEVILSKIATKAEKAKVFAKSSVVGDWKEAKYTVHTASLRSTNDGELIQVYQLLDSDGDLLDNYYYEWMMAAYPKA